MQRTATLTSVLLALVAAASAWAAVSPIEATGWNYDVVLNNPAPYDEQVTGTMDGGLGVTIEGWTWVEAGEYTNVDGVPQQFLGLSAVTQNSLTGNGSFTFQPFTGPNVIGLDNLNPTATLTLVAPASYKALAFFGASSYGAKTIDVTLNFSDASTTALTVAEGTGVGADWFNQAADRALVVGGRASNKSEEGYTRLFYQESVDIAINESYFTLSAADQAKTLTSVTFSTATGDRTSILAISGESTSTLAAADFNSDSFVNAADLSLWRTGYGMATGTGRANGNADGDDDVDGGDFLIWQQQLTGGAAAAVPEPGTALLAAAALALGARRRRL